MNVTFFKMPDDDRKINKTLSGGVTLDCDIRADIDIYDPVLLIRAWDGGYNYIQWNGRFYFITGVTYVARNTWEITTHIDVLMTYRDIILNADCLISQSSDVSPYYDGGDYESLLTFESEHYLSDVTVDNAETTVLVVIGNKGA